MLPGLRALYEIFILFTHFPCGNSTSVQITQLKKKVLTFVSSFIISSLLLVFGITTFRNLKH